MIGMRAALACAFCTLLLGPFASFCGAAPVEETSNYRVMEPIDSGGLILYPIARVRAIAAASHWRYLTLDDGLRTGQVVIEEAGKARGLARHPSASGDLAMQPEGDQVNTLVLVNNSKLPLLLLAGEIVTGGKQDRVIGKDRIVPPHSQPLDLSVFCIEPGRWDEKTPVFHATGEKGEMSFMVEPSVRAQAMVEQDQLRVWSAVRDSIAAERAGVPTPHPDFPSGGVEENGRQPMPGVRYWNLPATTSYAATMASPLAATQVDAVAKPVLGDDNKTIQMLLKENVVGVVAAIGGHIVWADIFATPEMLGAYWTKLVRSYAAESLHAGGELGPEASPANALRFAESPVDGYETSEGISTIYRYSEVHGQNESLFVLTQRTLDPGFEVHRTKVCKVEASSTPPDALDEPVRQPPPVRMPR